ncbi:kinase-like domain-containing protein [Gautieria morchelliformis]|nr:kinase-like domain-containing protein [Gautieria morchelliformis]
MDDDEDAFWDEDEFEEEHSIFFKAAEERCEIQAEIQDLHRAVPRLKEDYEVIDRLGTGTFSSVYKAIDLRHHEWINTSWRGPRPPGSLAGYQSAEHDPSRKFFVAIKRIYVTSMPERIRNEIAILEDVRGCRHVSQLITAFRQADQVVAIMPYHRNEDFRDYQHKLSMSGIKDYMRSLFRGLRDIHARGIIHRDIKPANFLFDPRTGIGTIVDLGLACRMNYNDDTACNHTAPSPDHPHGRFKTKEEIASREIKVAQQNARTRSRWPSDRVGYPENDTRPQSKANRAGTRGFRAPEVLLKCNSQSGAVDIWSAGTILLFFLTGKFPLFHCPDDTQALVEIAVVLGKRAVERAGVLHNRVIITNIPSVEPNGRDWSEFVQTLNPGLCEHHGSNGDDAVSSQRHEEDVTQAIDLLKATLEPESVKRVTARDALYHPFLKGEEDVGDDEFFPHPFGQGMCGMYHFKDSVSEDLCVIGHHGMQKVNAGDGIAIGNQPCEFHKDYPDFC